MKEITYSIGIVLALLGVGIIVFVIRMVSEIRKEGRRGLARAEYLMGSYTSKFEYSIGEYILYDADFHRILIKDYVYDISRIKCLEIEEISPKTQVTYKKETITKTDTRSVVARGVIGAIVAGPVGAVVGGVTANKKTEVKQIPERYSIPGQYIIKVIDIDGMNRGTFSFHDMNRFCELKDYLQSILNENIKNEKCVVEHDHKVCNIVESEDVAGLIVGGNIKQIDKLLEGSEVIKRADKIQFRLNVHALDIINHGWRSSFVRIVLTEKDGVLCKFNGVSRSFTSKGFNELMLEVSLLGQILEGKYGRAISANDTISQTSLSGNCPTLTAFKWSSEDGQSYSLDVLFEKGDYKYQLLLEQKQ